MSGVYNDAQRRASQKYIKNTDEIRTRVSKEKKQQILNHCESRNESTRHFILRAIDETINSDNKNNFYLVFVNKSKPTSIFKNNYLVTMQLKNVNSM